MRAKSIVAGCLLVVGILSAAAAGGAAEPVEQRLSVRADRNLSRRLNPVLERFGQPVPAKLAAGQTPEAYLSDLCGYARPSWTYDADDPTRLAIHHGPCLLVRRNRSYGIRLGDSLPAIGMHFGLLEGSLSELKVVKGPTAPPAARKDLYPGDKVIVPNSPAFTPVRLKPGIVGGRTAFVGALAEALGCGGTETPDACLQRYRVVVIDDTPQAVLPKAAPMMKARPAVVTPEAGPPLSSGYGPSGRHPRVAPTGAFAAAFAADAAADQPADPAVAPAPTAAQSTPVARGQWPYDRERVSKLLKAAAPPTGDFRTPVAVIDVGLMGQDGRPLPPDTYAKPDEDSTDPLSPYGDGVPFRADASSPVSICQGQFDNAATLLADPDVRAAFSHGAVTASLATGYAYQKEGTVPLELRPRLIFIRLYGAPCPPSHEASVQPSDVIKGVLAVADRVDIINLSWQDSGGVTAGLADTLANAIRASEKLLVVAAGNDGAENLNMAVGEFCPACLANPSYHPGGAVVDSHVLAVGAATARLTAEDFSGYGVPTVLLYAPGSPSGALDLEGHDASGFGASTSYAAPRVAFAAAVSRSLAPTTDMERIVKRLLISTWPLYDENGAEVPGAGVIDLTKVAALKTFAVEVREDQDGKAVLKTYVGPLTKPMWTLSLCAGPGYAADKWMGVALGKANPATGERLLTFYPQGFTNHVYKPEPKRCLPSGVVEIVDVTEGLKTLPLAKVTKILAPLKP